ncbi:hypothetical protein [Lichenicoccus sp.]|uniref:hypothetical protein n=1 Tax=Lichenicoccus sp. TaxID=2781899 RepID=UPI003D13822F
MDQARYDAIIIRSGPGGGSMAWKLAQTGKRILLIERGDYLLRRPRQPGQLGGVRRLAIPGAGDLVRLERRQLPSGTALMCRR